MRKFIINADDFGMCTSVNKGIVESMINGIVTSTTIMMNMPKAIEAINLAKENNITNIGIHLNLTKGYPLLDKEEIPSLVQENGKVVDIRKTLITPEIKVQLKKEFKAQIDLFISEGMVPTHLDSHHHIHMLDGVRDVVKELAIEYNLPVRSFEIKTANKGNVPTPDYLECSFYGKGVTMENIKSLLTTNQEGLIEIMSHPSYLGDDLYEISIYNDDRLKELEILTSQEIKDFVLEQKIELVSFKELTK